ncbi:MAG: homoserine O-acetyltransferase [Bacteroidetes bacterium]|nr:homoserine O-acetyltransferase [Bacteroidota bacterium]
MSFSNTDIISTRTVTLFSADAPLRMECGAVLDNVTVAFETYGSLNAAGDNAVLVCHALTGSAHAAGRSSDDPRSAGWWDSFIGPGRPLDTERFFVISSNFLGGCYGTTGSSSIDPQTGRPFGLSFPQMTVRDMVRVQQALIHALGVKRLATVIGGSLGGMQVLEWGVMFPELVASLIPIATSAQHSPWAVGLNDLARQAIMNDPEWRNGEYYPFGQPTKGFSLARQIAMMSYRSGIEFAQRFGRERLKNNDDSRFDERNLFQVESYLSYQGVKLVERFDANTYLYITRAMDLHDVAQGRGSVDAVLGSIRVPVLSVGIDTDILYPASEQRAIASAIPNSLYIEISSPYGHDAFLIEFEQMAAIVRDFLK